MTEEMEPKFGLTMKVATTVVGVIILIIGVIGNVMVISANRSRHMRTVTNLFITQLAVGDLAILFFCMPFTITSVFVFEGWPFGENMCKVVMFARNIGNYMSILTLVAMSAERYLMLLYPMKAKAIWTKRLVIKLMVLVLVLSAVCAVIQPIFSGVKKYEVTTSNSTGFVYHKHLILDCLPQPGMATTWYAWGRVVVLYLVPLALITFMYGRIAFHMAKKNKDKTLQTNEKVLRSRQRVVYMLLIMIVVFAVCWLPMNVFVMIEEIPGAYWFMTTPYFVPYFLTTIMLVYFSCISNPILYSLMSEQYRREFRRMVCGCVKDGKPLQSESGSTEQSGKTGISHVSTSSKSDG